MSRITNDTTAIEQAFSFALVNVFSGILLLVWVAYNMLTASLPFALLSLAVAPLMFLATVYFSGQARKAFRVAAKRSATSMPNCRRALPRCAKCRPSTAPMRTSSSSRKSTPPTAMPTSAPWPTPPPLPPHWKRFRYRCTGHRHRRGRLVSCCTGQTALRHNRHARPGGDLPRLRPALQPAHPADRRAVDQYPERHRRRGTHLRPSSMKSPPCRIKPGAKDHAADQGQGRVR